MIPGHGYQEDGKRKENNAKVAPNQPRDVSVYPVFSKSKSQFPKWAPRPLP